ncbi:MAG: hypothetical protein Q8877_03300, partial [Sweet potato little leaf phytoplasma]|nr:hypothetical protein [Sweet potato little leaf phytoplasma]
MMLESTQKDWELSSESEMETYVDDVCNEDDDNESIDDPAEEGGLLASSEDTPSRAEASTSHGG